MCLLVLVYVVCPFGVCLFVLVWGHVLVSVLVVDAMTLAVVVAVMVLQLVCSWRRTGVVDVVLVLLVAVVTLAVMTWAVLVAALVDATSAAMTWAVFVAALVDVTSAVMMLTVVVLLLHQGPHVCGVLVALMEPVAGLVGRTPFS